jgi:hypothetical protein
MNEVTGTVVDHRVQVIEEFTRGHTGRDLGPG